MLSTTGLKLSLVTLAGLGLNSEFDIVNGAWWMKLGFIGLALAALCYVYNDMRTSYRQRDLDMSQHTSDIVKIMTDHKNDIWLIVKENMAAMTTVTDVVTRVSAANNEVLRDNVQIIAEVKAVIKANTDAIVWCRDTALTRTRDKGT